MTCNDGRSYSSLARLVCSISICVNLASIAWLDWRHSPVFDEAAHLATASYVLETGRFDFYSVNPPLTRYAVSIATLPFMTDSSWIGEVPRKREVGARPEWKAGVTFVLRNPDNLQLRCAAARWLGLVSSAVGGYVCWRWAGELYGHNACVVAIILWCSSPAVLAWGGTICPDLPATAFGISATYCFWKWLCTPCLVRAVQSGTMLGVALLTKSTWILLFGVWPLAWVILNFRKHEGIRQSSLQFAGILCIGLLILNCGYGFSNTCRLLGDIHFGSVALAGSASIVHGGVGGNRFVGSWAGLLPIPLPADFVRGIDLQKIDFETGLESYLCGKWSKSGWWYYYLACALLKVPLGTWMLALASAWSRLVAKRRATIEGSLRTSSVNECDRTACRQCAETLIGVTFFSLLLLVSSQTGVNHHFRYVLPMFPFVCIWVGAVGQFSCRANYFGSRLLILTLLWIVVSSLSVYPHSMSYFNELSGGPLRGDRYLLHSNVDWGQDLYHLKSWIAHRNDVHHLQAYLRNPYSTRILTDSTTIFEHDARPQLRSIIADEPLGYFIPVPGWYAASIHRLHVSRSLQWLLRMKPVASVGYSIRVFHVSLAEANEQRRLLGLQECSWNERKYE